MRISSTVHYASRLLVNLAQHTPAAGPLSASELAEHTGISVKFIEKIIRQLRTAGMVRSVRGATGGHLLSMRPEDVTLGAVLRVVEGGVQPPNCCVGDDCEDTPCRCKAAWTSAAKALEATLDQYTLADIMSTPPSAKERSAKHGGSRQMNSARYGRTNTETTYAQGRTCAHQSQ